MTLSSIWPRVTSPQSRGHAQRQPAGSFPFQNVTLHTIVQFTESTAAYRPDKNTPLNERQGQYLNIRPKTGQTDSSSAQKWFTRR